MAAQALDGIRVVDLTRLVAGNMATLQLADFGADVIKLEQPGRGDPLRHWRNGGKDLWWREYGRNKRSLALNLKTAAGRDILLRLARSADVLAENFVPGGLAALGLGDDALPACNPRLVILSITAWGHTGPYRSRPGFGTLVEAMSGLAAMTGFPDRPPTLPPIPVADMVAGLYGAFAVLAALRHRDRTGEGQVIDLSLLEPIFSILGPVAVAYRLNGHVAQRNGNRSPNNAPRNTYRTRDGQWIAISASTPVMVERFLGLLGLGALLTDERFATNEARLRHGDALDAQVADAIARFDLAPLMERVAAEGVGVAPVYDVAQLLADPHVVARGLVEDVADPELGPVPMHAPLPRLSRTAGRIRAPGPPLGAHTAEILRELGLADAEDALRDAGAI